MWGLPELDLHTGSLIPFYEEIESMGWERHLREELTGQVCWHLAEAREYGSFWSGAKS